MTVVSIQEKTALPTVNIAIDTLKRKKQALFFVGTKAAAEKTAEEIAHSIKKEKIAVHSSCQEAGQKILSILSPATKQCQRLAACISSGVAFHHAGLVEKQKKLVEDAFRNGIIPVIVCTPTLCLSGDTKIWHELKETAVSSFKIDDSLFVLNGSKLIQMSPHLIQKLKNNKPLIGISSVSGYSITVTPNHKMLVKRGGNKALLQAKHIRKGDKIATARKISLSSLSRPSLAEFVKDNKMPVFNQEITCEMLYFIGAMLGDGYSGAETVGNTLTYKGSPCIVGRDEEIFLKGEEICDRLKISHKRQKSVHGIPQLILGKNKWFREFLVRVGIEKGHEKYISEKIMTMPLDSVSWLIKGLFDTDGWVELKSGGVGFSNTSKRLVKQIQKLLLRFGIVSHVRERPIGTMKIYEKEYKTKPHFELTITQKISLLDFYRFIGFFVKRKQEVLFEKVSKISSNLLYVSCKGCHYKIYRDILIKKRREGSRSKTEWYWSLNSIGQWIYNNILLKEKDIIEFFSRRECPVCNKEMERVVKKGWRDSDFEGDIFWDIVRSVELSSIEKVVYDVILPSQPENDHFFVAEGFIVHNSMGVDLPAYRTIIRDLKRFSLHQGSIAIPVLEYHQMAGRAGRPGKDVQGEAITIAKTAVEKDAIYEEYIIGEVEDIYSKLAVEPVLRTYLLSMIATGVVATKQQIMDFFTKTFWAHQYRDRAKLEAIISKMLHCLVQWGFLQTNQPAFSSAAEVETEKYEATRLGKRVSELYLDPLTAHHLVDACKKIPEQIFSFPLFHLLIMQLELRPLLRIRAKEYSFVEELLMQWSNKLLISEPATYDPDYDDFLRSIKTTHLFQRWIEEASEDTLLKEFNIRPGELLAKKERLLWLLYGAAELTRIQSLYALEKEFRKLHLRVSYGVKEEVLSLLRLQGIGRVRARVLFNHKIRDLGDVRTVD